jgi:hypothetical protein
MKNPQIFDYDRPARDTLAGIYVETSDEVLGQAGCADSAGHALPLQAELFGVTVTVDDSVNTKQPARS